MRMPNRTVYLPDDLDEASRRLKLNLSHVVQQAIRDLAAERDPLDVEAEIEAASLRARALGIDWSDFSLAESRDGAQER